MKFKILVFSLLMGFSLNVLAKGEGDSFIYDGKLPVRLSYYGLGRTFITGMILMVPTAGLGLAAACDTEYGEQGCPTHEAKVKTLHPKAKVVVNKWGESRITVLLIVNGTKSCSGVQSTYVGFGTPTGSFDLYEQKGEELPVPNHDNAVARLTFGGGNEVFIQLTKGVGFQTAGKEGKACVWEVAADTALEFKR